MPSSALAPLATVIATRYVTPFREGGSMPGLIEADDDGLYVVKFRGAGQGEKALVAELICAGIARAIGLAVPDVVLVDLDPELARAEPDPEVQELIRASAGVNFGIDFLPGSLTFDPAADGPVDPSLAASIVWFDALVLNVDRTPRNPNLLVWHGRLRPIDHGAALYFHHGSWEPAAAAARAFPVIRDHVLLEAAGPIDCRRRGARRFARAGGARSRRRCRARRLARRRPCGGARALRRVPRRSGSRSRAASRRKPRRRGARWRRDDSRAYARACATAGAGANA